MQFFGPSIAVLPEDLGGPQVIVLDGAAGRISVGIFSFPGEMVLIDESGEVQIRMFASADNGVAIFGGSSLGGLGGVSIDGRGRIEIRTSALSLDGESQGLAIRGGHESLLSSSSLRIANNAGETRILVDGQTARLELGDDLALNGNTGNIALGGTSADGDLFVNTANGARTVHIDGGAATIVLGERTIHINGETGNISLGGGGADGDLFVRTETGRQTVRVDGAQASLVLGAPAVGADSGIRGRLELLGGVNGENTIALDGRRANMRLGGRGDVSGNIFLENDSGDRTLELNGETGDIIMTNADCAEEFDLADEERPEPGTVVVIDESGAVRTSRTPRDTRVAGVIAGAGSHRPGIVLDRQADGSPRVPVSLLGKAFCKVDADEGEIRAGDLLTTAPRPGHAMRAVDPASTIGAVLGKALRPCARGLGLVPILVMLR